MKIAELTKDYKAFVAKKLSSPDEVFTSRELFTLSQESNIICGWDGFRRLLAEKYPHVTIGRFVYYGNEASIAKARKATEIK